MTRLIGSLVMRNEAHRYLADCLAHLRPLVDDLFIFDDRSTDESVEIAKGFDAYVVRRAEATPSFLEHEGRFRLAAWQSMESLLRPQLGDWLIAIDADEFPVHWADTSAAAEEAIGKANRKGATGVVLPFPEVFGIDDGIPQIRTDGLWGTVKGPRLFRYQEGADWSDKPMGCGSEPTYVGRGPLSNDACGISVLHFGYARREDVETKYRRYSGLYQHGHSDRHIQSIPQPPTLKPWDGPVPEWVKNAV